MGTRKRRRFTEAFKQEAVRLCLRHDRSIGQVARGHCQVADERAFFSLGAERPSLGQQAHVTSSH